MMSKSVAFVSFSALFTIFTSFFHTADASCSMEFDTCVTNRDCCGSLTCVTGDWAVTTDSTCLSSRSTQLDALPRENKLDLLTKFYTEKAPEDKRKSAEEAEALLDKNLRSFAKLVSRIEKKYVIPVSTLENEEL